jgi:choline-sulfatase
MARRGTHKYVHITGHEGQLFDLEADPHEWDNLVGDPDHRGIVRDMREAILGRFDPDRIEAELRDSIRRRRLIQWAMHRNGTSWDVCPRFSRRRNSRTQYEPGGVE